ncbi:MAG: lysozyme inhibitor LprI family protein [Gemmatimonadaceae bacterium]
MLTGRRPWSGEGLQSVLHKQKNEQLPPLDELRPDVPAFLLDAINGGLAKDSRERWQDAEEFLARLTPPPVSTVPGGGDAGWGTRTLTPGNVASNTRGANENRYHRRTSVTAAQPSFGEPITTGPHAPFDANQTGEARGARRRWWPIAGALVAAALLFVVFQAGGGESSASGGKSVDPAMDSLLAATLSDSAAGALLNTPTPTTRPVTIRDNRRKATPRSAILYGSPTAKPAAARVMTLDERCRSLALADQTACLLMLIERDAAELNHVYQMFIAALRRDAGGVREPAEVQLLRTEQRAWLAERDRVCRIRTLVSEDPLWGVKRAPCFAELSKRRANELDKRLGRIMARSDIRRR